MAVIVYVIPSSVPCTATYRALDSKGIEYEVVDISTDLVAMGQVIELGYQQAPVVTTPWDHWGGFRPDKIDGLALVLECERAVEAAQRALSEAIEALQKNKHNPAE